MIKTKDEYDNLIIKILESVISGHVPSPANFPDFSEKEFNEALFQCVENQFIVGYHSYRMDDGSTYSKRIGEPSVTIDGFSYMDSVKQAQALKIAQAAEKNSIVAKLNANKAFILSVVSILLTVIINLDKLVTNLSKLLSYLNLLK